METTLVFDFDGVICANNGGSYHDAPAFTYSIAQINAAYDYGYEVVIATARYGMRHPGEQYQFGFEEATKWLKDNGVKYHKLFMGKPAGMIYVDDKGCRIQGDNREDWDHFWDRVKELDGLDQYNQTIEKS